MMLVAFHLHRKPVSLNARPNPMYTLEVAEGAQSCYGGPMLAGDLYSRIIWFHKYRTTQGDVDNVAKRIHDALKGVLFADDGTITRSMTARVDATDSVELMIEPEDPSSALALAESLDDEAIRDILYIEIGHALNSRVYLGPPK